MLSLKILGSHINYQICLVTESLTLIAGKGRAFAFAIDKVLTPVVVSSVTVYYF